MSAGRLHFSFKNCPKTHVDLFDHLSSRRPEAFAVRQNLELYKKVKPLFSEFQRQFTSYPGAVVTYAVYLNHFGASYF